VVHETNFIVTRDDGLCMTEVCIYLASLRQAMKLKKK
jgi:hypothetical protein